MCSASLDCWAVEQRPVSLSPVIGCHIGPDSSHLAVWAMLGLVKARADTEGLFASRVQIYLQITATITAETVRSSFLCPMLTLLSQTRFTSAAFTSQLTPKHSLQLLYFMRIILHLQGICNCQPLNIITNQPSPLKTLLNDSYTVFHQSELLFYNFILAVQEKDLWHPL